MRSTTIEWADDTFNPWWGCQRVSPGCERCYAETWGRRWGVHWGPSSPRRYFGDGHWREPLTWARQAEREGARRRVFCASMADVFERVSPLRSPTEALSMDAARLRLWSLIESTPALDWLLLTKRPENVTMLVPPSWLARWPRHVWLGTTVEDRARAMVRLPVLLRVREALDLPCAFVSYEPALELVDFRPWFGSGAIDWIIIGGESGRGARPFDLAWARQAIDDARQDGVAPFLKQLGSGSDDLVVLKRSRDDKRGDMDRWPAELRVRELPRVRAARAA